MEKENNISVEFTKEECSKLIALIDIAIKVQGLKVSEIGTQLALKIASNIK